MNESAIHSVSCQTRGWISSRVFSCSESQPHMRFVDPQAGQLAGPPVTTAPAGSVISLPAISDSVRSVSARSSFGRPRGGAVPISLASSAESSLLPVDTRFPSLLSPQIESGDAEAKQTATRAECNGDAHPRQQDPREDVWRCQEHQGAREETSPPAERSLPRRFRGEAKESYRDSERPRGHIRRIAPARPELESKAGQVAL
jgi:hypothetical protein